MVVLVSGWVLQICYGFGTFGFDMHHRYSDPIKGILGVDELPEKHSLQYYRTMAHHDLVIHGRRLAGGEVETQLTFFGGNETYRMSSLGLYALDLPFFLSFFILINSLLLITGSFGNLVPFGC